MGSHAEVQLSELYREVVMDHYRHPRGRTPLARADITAKGFNPVCGDEVEVALALSGEHIAQAQVITRGCAICTASASMMAEILPGKDLREAEEDAEAVRRLMHGEAIPPDRELGDLKALEGVRHFPVRVKCALLPWMTLRNAIGSFQRGEQPTLVTTE
ncbi:MAG: Fe-S cluster assembly sulfur transfer protein SufU [Thermoanaerobaculaceae bacterium]